MKRLLVFAANYCLLPTCTDWDLLLSCLFELWSLYCEVVADLDTID